MDEPAEEYGVADGNCPFVVHGLVDNNVLHKNWTQMSSLALKHICEGDSVLGITHAEKPQLIFSNPSLYPQIFP